MLEISLERDARRGAVNAVLAILTSHLLTYLLTYLLAGDAPRLREVGRAARSRLAGV